MNYMFNDPKERRYGREIILEKKLRYFESYAKDPQILSKRMPFVKAVIQSTLPKVYRAAKGSTVEVEGYLALKFRDNKFFPQTVIKWLKEMGVDTSRGFKTYDFHAELTRIYTGVVVIAPFEFQMDAEFPYKIKIIRLGRITSLEEVFYLKEEPEPTFLQPHLPDPDIPLLTQKQMHRCLTQISSLSMKDRHVFNAVVSPYVGADWVKRTSYIDGIGNSFLENEQLTDDLKKLNDLLNNPQWGLPLSHHGVLNVLNSTPVAIEQMRASQKFQKFRTVSWNLPTNQRANNFKQSELKYYTDGMNIYDLRDMRNDAAFQYSLMYCSLIKDKGVTFLAYDSAMLKALKTVEGWVGKTNEEIINQIVDGQNLDMQVGRITSYFFGIVHKVKDEDVIVRKVNDAINQNIGSLIENIHLEAPISEKKLSHEREISRMVRFAFLRSGRTKQGFIEKLMEFLGYSEKRATSYVEQLESKGIIYVSDGVHYHWATEGNFKFKK